MMDNAPPTPETLPVLEAPMIPDASCPPVRSSASSGVERAFNVSIIVSGVRCTLAYVLLPFVAPFIGLAPGIGPALGLAIGAIAIVANVLSMRRFWRARHPWRKPVTVIHMGMIAFLVVLMTIDAMALIG